jgi:hypothetical protein
MVMELTPKSNDVWEAKVVFQRIGLFHNAKCMGATVMSKFRCSRLIPDFADHNISTVNVVCFMLYGLSCCTVYVLLLESAFVVSDR